MKKFATTTLAPSPAQAGNHWSHALRGALVLMVLCGVLYPVLTASVGAILFPHQATGSLIERDGKVVGSVLVGQPFSASGYFHGRPSTAGYDPFRASGSNWAPGNPELHSRAQTTSEKIAQENGITPDSIPVDLVAASGSGIDPDISPEAAKLQIDRVATARGIPRAEIAELVAAQVQAPVLGVLGQPHVNVLQLNLELDKLSSKTNL